MTYRLQGFLSYRIFATLLLGLIPMVGLLRPFFRGNPFQSMHWYDISIAVLLTIVFVAIIVQALRTFYHTILTVDDEGICYQQPSVTIRARWQDMRYLTASSAFFPNKVGIFAENATIITKDKHFKELEQKGELNSLPLEPFIPNYQIALAEYLKKYTIDPIKG